MRYIVGLCFCLYMITWPAILAKDQGKWPTQACSSYRGDLGFAMLWSIAPPAWFMAPFLTGFYEYGFQVFPLERCKR
jgi:hypothetical protein